MGDLVDQKFCEFASAPSSSRFRTVIAAEWKTLRTRSDVSSPSGRSHIAGAVSSWQVSRVILSGLRRVVRRDAAVDSSLHHLLVVSLELDAVMVPWCILLIGISLKGA